MLQVLEQIEQDRQQEAGTNFAIYKSLIKKLVQSRSLSGSDRQKLGQLSITMGISLVQIDKTVADLRELASIEATLEDIAQLETQQAAAGEKAKAFDEKTREMRDEARAKMDDGAKRFHGEYLRGDGDEYDWRQDQLKEFAKIEAARRKDSEAFWGIAQALSKRIDAAGAAGTRAEVLRKQYAALLVE